MPNWSSDDLAGVIINADREMTGRAQGMIRAFNPDTFANTVNVRGTDLHDLAVSASGIEAQTYRPGDVVIVEKWKPRSGRGSATYSIASRWLEPADGRAEEAIAFMRGGLVKALINDLVEELLTSPEGILLAAFVFGDRMIPAEVETLESTTSTSYGNLATVGPTVSDVEVTDRGKALVFVSANLSTDTGDGANMSFTVSGATSRDAGQTGTLSLVTAGSSIAGSVTKAVPLDLNPGVHTFQAKYRSGSGGIASFNQRVLTVIAF